MKRSRLDETLLPGMAFAVPSRALELCWRPPESPAPETGL
jgi:hypothetical protein